MEAVIKTRLRLSIIFVVCTMRGIQGQLKWKKNWYYVQMIKGMNVNPGFGNSHPGEFSEFVRVTFPLLDGSHLVYLWPI